MTRRLATLAGAALAFLSLAANARADGPCKPLSEVQAELRGMGGVLTKLSVAQLMFARGLFVASPPVSPYPHGEAGLLATFDDGAGVIVFVEGSNFCGKMGMSPVVTKLLVDLEKSI